MRRALATLHDWARIDRHRRLHVVASAATIEGDVSITVPPPARVIDLQVCGRAILEQDCEIASFSIPGWAPGLDISVDAELHVELAVDEPSDLRRESLSEATTAMLDAVGQVLNVFGCSFGFCEAEDRVRGHPPRRVGPWSVHTGIASDG